MIRSVTNPVLVIACVCLVSCGPTNGPGGSVGTHVPVEVATSDTPPIEVQESRDDDGKLLRRVEGWKDADGKLIPHGTWTNYWENGQKKSEIHYVNGLRHGPRTAWYQNGQIWSQGRFVDGREDGTWMVWHPEGRKIQQRQFDYGAWHGTWTDWHQNGRKKREVVYVKGKKQGPMTFWDEAGNLLKQDNYVDDIQQP